jgi:hypothetical protein
VRLPHPVILFRQKIITNTLTIIIVWLSKTARLTLLLARESEVNLLLQIRRHSCTGFN